MVFAGRAVKAAGRGMRGGLGQNLFIRNADGTHATDPVTLNRIPVKRAVRIGKHYFNSKSLGDQLQHRTTNPLTRQPFPSSVIRKYKKKPPSPPSPPRALLDAIEAIVQYVRQLPRRVFSLSSVPIDDLVRPFGVSWNNYGALKLGDWNAYIEMYSGREFGPSGRTLGSQFKYKGKKMKIVTWDV